MRRVLVALVLVCACSASPQPPSVLKARPRPFTLELTGTPDATSLVRRDPDGQKTYELPLGKVKAAIAAIGEAAYAVVEEYSGKTGPSGAVVRISTEGREIWRARAKTGTWPSSLHLAAVRDCLFVFDGKTVHVLNVVTGADKRDYELERAVSDAAEQGDVLAVADARGVTRLTPTGDPMWSTQVHLFPSPDPSVDRKPERKIAVAADGTLLTGASDGSLLAFDAEGRPLYQLGVRGAVSHIEARFDGDFDVRTRSGLVTVIGPGGVVRSESGPTNPDTSPDREVVDKRDSHPSLAPWKPTTTARARREGLGGKPFHDVPSVLVLAEGDVWALVRGDAIPGRIAPAPHLVHYDGNVWSDLGVPTVPFAKEVYAEGQPAATSEFTPTRLARGPAGALVVLGERGPQPRRTSVIERSGSGFRERRDLSAILAKIEPPYGSVEITYAVSAGGHEVLCDGAPSTCIEKGPSIPARLLPLDQGRTMPASTQQPDQTPIVFAGETLWKTKGSANNEADVWGIGKSAITHWNGSAFEHRDAPLSSIGTLSGNSGNDLWIAGAAGIAHFDGQRWSRILEIDGDSQKLSVTGSRQGDAWVFGYAGLWHVTPNPQAEPDLDGKPAPSPPAAEPSHLILTAPDPSYHLERVVLDVPGEPPLRAALGVVEGSRGKVWFYDGARVVEYDGGRTRVIHRAPKPEPLVCWSSPQPDCEVCVECTARRPKPIGCQRCAALTSAGVGAVLGEEGLVRISSEGAAAEPTALASLIAVTAAPSGSFWAVSARSDDGLPHAVIQGPAGPRIVAGLSPAAYADVSVRADDDVWMSGGLTTGEDSARAWPEGEGLLVHFDGVGFTRYRGPDGALLSVAAAGRGEAWAVGLGGGVVHATAGGLTAYHLDQDVILRGVATTGSSEVWIVGDASMLLHWDGEALRRVDANAAGTGAALSAVIPPGTGQGWVVGPSGIWKVVH